jgi:hypothetical protein
VQFCAVEMVPKTVSVPVVWARIVIWSNRCKVLRVLLNATLSLMLGSVFISRGQHRKSLAKIAHFIN